MYVALKGQVSSSHTAAMLYPFSVVLDSALVPLFPSLLPTPYPLLSFFFLSDSTHPFSEADPALCLEILPSSLCVSGVCVCKWYMCVRVCLRGVGCASTVLMWFTSELLGYVKEKERERE